MNEATSELVILKDHCLASKRQCQRVHEVSPSLNKGERERETEICVAH